MAKQEQCVFCKIVAGELPSLKVEDAETAMAFLDIGPLADGHLLVVPKKHYVQLHEMPSAEVSSLAGLLPRLSQAVLQVSGAEGYNILQNNGRVAGQVVEHVHWHIIPRRGNDGLGYRWQAGKYAAGRGEKLQSQLLQALKSIS